MHKITILIIALLAGGCMSPTPLVVDDLTLFKHRMDSLAKENLKEYYMCYQIGNKSYSTKVLIPIAHEFRNKNRKATSVLPQMVPE